VKLDNVESVLTEKISEMSSKMSDEISALSLKLDDKATKTSVIELEICYKELELKVDNMPSNSNSYSEDDIKKWIQDGLTENNLKFDKRNNLMIFNLAVPDDGSDSDRCIELFKKMDINTDGLKIVKTIRIGKDQPDSIKPLCVTLEPRSFKFQILENAIKLRKVTEPNYLKNVYVKPDLTKMQASESKNLVTQLRDKKSSHPNKKFMIKKGQIVEVTSA
jgi:hypothetical protein